MAEQEKTEYADFSDLENKEIPDEIEEQAKPDENMTFGYDENTTMEETPKEESTEETPKDEPPKETSQKEDPSKDPYWQSKYDREIAPAKQEAEKLRQEIETIKAQLNPTPKEEPLVRPQKPNTDDPLDLIRYNQELSEYQEKFFEQKFKSVDAYFQQAETERQGRIQQEEMGKQRAWQVSQLVQHGKLSPEEANEALVEFSKAADSPEQYFRDLGEFHKFRKGITPKTSKVEQRASRQGALPPLGTVPSETETQAENPDDALFNDMQGFIRKNY